jgi:hypothetical protein
VKKLDGYGDGEGDGEGDGGRGKKMIREEIWVLWIGDLDEDEVE